MTERAERDYRGEYAGQAFSSSYMVGTAAEYVSDIPAIWAYLWGKSYTYQFNNESITNFRKYSYHSVVLLTGIRHNPPSGFMFVAEAGLAPAISWLWAKRDTPSPPRM